MRNIIFILLLFSLAGYGQGGFYLASIKQAGGGASLIPASADIAELEFYITAREQGGADGSDVSSISDLSANGLTVTPTEVDLDIVGGKYEFDLNNAGSNERIDIGNPAVLQFDQTEDCSICIVLGSDAPDNASTLWAKHDKALGGLAENALFLVDFDTGFAEIYNTGISKSPYSGGFPVDGDMVCLTKTWSSPNAVIRMYINGVLQDGTDNVTTTTTRAANWFIGLQKDGAGWSNPLGGNIREFMIFSKALSTGEMDDIKTDIDAF